LRMSPGKLRTFRILVWALTLALTFSFLGLCVLSADNYTRIAYAKLSAEARANLSMEAAGLGPSGEVMDTTVFYYNATVNVTNPSQRSLKLQYVKYQGWVEDYIREDQYGGTDLYFYSNMVEDENYQAQTGLVGPQSTKTFAVNWTFDNARLDQFDVTQRILNYVLINSTRHLRWDEANWNHFWVFRLLVTDVPMEYYGPDSAYLIELPVIVRYQGVSHGG